MRVIAHLGPRKTGSTALQNTLAQNRNLLSSQGVLYPELLGYKAKNNHNILEVGAKDPSIIRKTTSGMIKRSRLSRSKIFRDEAEFVRKQLKQKSYNYLILSSEELFQPLSKLGDDFWRRLLPFDEFYLEFVCYYRDPADRLLSELQELLKRSHLPELREDTIRMPNVLEQIEAAYPGRLKVKCFETVRANKNDITRDFLNDFVPHLNADAISSVRANETMSAEAMVILQEYRQRFYPESPSTIQFDVDRLLSELKKIGEMGGRVVKPKLLPEVKDRVYRYLSEDIEWMAAHYDVDISKYRDHQYGSYDGRFAIGDFKNIRKVVQVDEDRLQNVRSRLPKWCFNPALRYFRSVLAPRAMRTVRRVIR